MLDTDFTQLFHASFNRAVNENQDHFYVLFYENFMASSPAIKEVFKSTNMHRQREMLHESLLNLISFSQSFKVSRYLTKVAKAHGVQGFGFPEEFYDKWLAALMKTVADVDPLFSPKIEMAWRVVLSPGLVLMLNYDRFMADEF